MTNNAVGADVYRPTDAVPTFRHLLLDHVSGDAEPHLSARFVYSHAAELFMESFLSLKGTSSKDLCAYRHDLTLLYEACHEYGLAISITNHRTLSQPIVLTRSGPSDYQFRDSERSKLKNTRF